MQASVGRRKPVSATPLDSGVGYASDAQRSTTIIATGRFKCSFYLRDRKNRLRWRVRWSSPSLDRDQT